MLINETETEIEVNEIECEESEQLDNDNLALGEVEVNDFVAPTENDSDKPENLLEKSDIEEEPEVNQSRKK